MSGHRPTLKLNHVALLSSKARAARWRAERNNALGRARDVSFFTLEAQKKRRAIRWNEYVLEECAMLWEAVAAGPGATALTKDEYLSFHWQVPRKPCCAVPCVKLTPLCTPIKKAASAICPQIRL